MMTYVLVSTKARTSDPMAVRDLLDSYALSGVTIELFRVEAEWALTMEFWPQDVDGEQGPEALPYDQWPQEDLLPDSEKRTPEVDSWQQKFDEAGEAGFFKFLRSLARHLTTPLLILALHRTSRGCSARAWSVQPGEGQVVEMIETGTL